MSEGPAWYKALTLSERIRLKTGLGTGDSHPREGFRSSGTGRDKHIKKWKSQSPFDQDAWFAQFLEHVGIDEIDFVDILANFGESVWSFKVPSWVRMIEKSLFMDNAGADFEEDSFVRRELRGFLVIVLPLVRQARLQVVSGIQALVAKNSVVPFDPGSVAELLFSGLPQRLGGMIGRVGVLELHVAKAERILEGDTPEARFQSFVDKLRRPEVALKILSEYPVLARLVVECLEWWVESSLEFIARLCADWNSICSVFNEGRDPGILTEVEAGLGDSHRKGRSVVLLRFSSGFQLVYKPKSLAVDVCFRELLDWLHERGAPALRVPKVLSRDVYGWSEFVTSRPCSDREEIARFYERQGALLALLYALEANDFHNENLIAVGEHPVLVDLESLFQADYGQGDSTIYRSAASFVMSRSVLGVGILPNPQQGKDERLLDRSGLGGQGGQVALREVALWENMGTDEMRLVRKYCEISAAANRPSLAGEEVDLIEFSGEIGGGFERMYRLLMEFRHDLAGRGGVLEMFADLDVRAIFRITQFYSLLLSESFHPDLLRDAVERDRLFSRLWFGLDQSPLAKDAMMLIPSELEDLWRGDVPFFYTKVHSRDVWSSDGLCLPKFFRRSGWDAVSARFDSLSDEDLRQQMWFIRGSLAATAIASQADWTSYSISGQSGPVGADDLIDQASLIGDRLVELAICREDDVSWVGLSLVGGRNWALLPFGLDLYGGLPGILLFLAYLGWVTGNRRYTDIAKLALSSIQRELKRGASHTSSIGGFEGWGGLIHVWVHLSVLWGRDDLLSEALRMADLIAPLVAKDKALDVVSGSAGGAAALLELHKISGAPSVLSLARSMGDKIVSQAIPIGKGVGWLVPTNPSLPLTGFSHGASGMAWSLLNLFEATGIAAYRDVALEALAFERGVFMSDSGNWPDFRGMSSVDVGVGKFMTAWCHGASGIGLSRLKMLPLLPGTYDVEEDIAAALFATLATGFGGNHSLCHGDLGNLDFILCGSQVVGGAIWETHLERLTSKIFASIAEFGWLCGVPLGAETPGLLCGLAGIGYQLLRLALPGRVPSILLLESPAHCGLTGLQDSGERGRKLA